MARFSTEAPRMTDTTTISMDRSSISNQTGGIIRVRNLLLSNSQSCGINAIPYTHRGRWTDKSELLESGAIHIFVLHFSRTELNLEDRHATVSSEIAKGYGEKGGCD